MSELDFYEEMQFNDWIVSVLRPSLLESSRRERNDFYEPED